MLILTGIPFNGDKIRGSNSFTDAITTGTGAPFDGLTIDYCFMNPPYGGDKSKGKEYKFAYSKKVKAEDGSTSKKFFVNQEIQSIGIEDDDKVSAGVQLAMATLSADGGVCSIVLPQGFFFGASKKCVELRKKIAEEYKIWFVVDISSGSFLNTGTKTSMMVFQKGVGPTEKVAFIGIDEKPLVEATLAELRTKHYSLNYKQYLPQSAVEVEGFEMVKLGNIAEWQMGKRIVKDQVETGKYPVYGGGGITFYTNTSNRSDNNCKISREGMSEANCVLMITGDYYQNSQGMTVVSKDTQKVLNSYLWNWLVVHKKAVYECGQGTAQKAINMVMLNDLDVPIPSLERQQQIVEAIDGWASLAQQEEVALKILEKQMMFQVKEMGRGQARVKLGALIDVNYGERITKKESQGDLYPVFGSGGDTFRYEKKNREGVTCKVGRFAISEHNCVQIMFTDYWCLDSALTIRTKDANLKDCYVWYWLLNNKYLVYECSRGTAQQHIDMDSFRNFEIPLPPLTEQQTLQSDFDEIRHKHVKIATYKAKAYEAIQRLIPGTNPV
jgi:restriction endonuclease S subunit